MDLLIGQHDSIVEIVYLDNRELVDILSDTLEIVACSLLECRRDAECHDHSGNCRMDSGIEHHVPEDKTDCHIKCLRTDLYDICSDHQGHTCC